MRTSIIFFVSGIIALLTMIPSISFSQKKGGQIVISADAGISPMGVFASMGANSNANTDVFRASPVYLGNIDVGITKLISVGVSSSYQSFRYYYDHSTNMGLIRCKDVTTRASYGGRLLFHFAKEDKEKIDAYAGVRVGYADWNLSTTNPSVDYTVKDYEDNQPWGLRLPLSERHDFHFTAQVLYGFRYNFSKFAGMNFEVSIGGPVFFAVGLQTKIF